MLGLGKARELAVIGGWLPAALALASALTLAACAALGAGAAQARQPDHHQIDVIPVFAGQLQPAMGVYRSYVSNELDAIAAGLPALLSAEQNDELAAAQADWLTLHLDWLLIGQDDGAYGAFGALGRSIDATAAGYVDGTADQHFTGFHRIEYDLWTSGDLSAATADTEVLEGLIAQLQSIRLAKELPDNPNGLQTWVLRAHEILEDADRDTLTGDDDYGSGTGVASVVADAAATRELLKLLKPVIYPRAPKLVARCDGDLARIDRVAARAHSGGVWTALGALPLSLREALNGAVGKALENLAPISDLIHVEGANI